MIGNIELHLEEFFDKYCKMCGTQRCDRSEEMREGCPHWHRFYDTKEGEEAYTMAKRISELSQNKINKELLEKYRLELFEKIKQTASTGGREVRYLINTNNYEVIRQLVQRFERYGFHAFEINEDCSSMESAVGILIQW